MGEKTCANISVCLFGTVLLTLKENRLIFFSDDQELGLWLHDAYPFSHFLSHMHTARGDRGEEEWARLWSPNWAHSSTQPERVVSDGVERGGCSGERGRRIRLFSDLATHWYRRTMWLRHAFKKCIFSTCADPADNLIPAEWLLCLDMITLKMVATFGEFNLFL